MSAEISPELREKLRIIEVETDFFWHQPEPAKFPKFYFWFSIIVFAVFAAVSISQEGDGPGKEIWLMMFVMFGFNMMIYFHTKQQHKLYSKACDLIRYYKLLTNPS